VYLPEAVFLHGQLYVMLSRAIARSNIKILVVPANEKDVNKRKRKKKLARVCSQRISSIKRF
jgi:ATP-dependent DNA helicase PIF1